MLMVMETGYTDLRLHGGGEVIWWESDGAAPDSANAIERMVTIGIQFCDRSGR